MKTLDAYVTPSGKQLWALCLLCDRLHFHGNTGDGPRIPHCKDPDAPAYDLRILGEVPSEWMSDPDRVHPRRLAAV